MQFPLRRHVLFSYGQSKVPFPHLEILMSGGYVSQKIEDEVLCFGIAFYKRRCIVKKNRVLEVPRLLAVIKTDDWGTFLKNICHGEGDEK